MSNEELLALILRLEERIKALEETVRLLRDKDPSLVK